MSLLAAEPAAAPPCCTAASSMSPICSHFVQNAWRQDLCSNCFRLRQDHSLSSSTGEGPTAVGSSSLGVGRYAVYQSATSWRRSSCSVTQTNSTLLSPAPSAGILRTSLSSSSSAGSSLRRASTGSVGFLDVEPQVIGYGGVDEEEEEEEEEAYDSVEEDDDYDDGACDSLENYDLSEEERAFAQLTEKNTEFNAVMKNLLAERHLEELARNNHNAAETLPPTSISGLKSSSATPEKGSPAGSAAQKENAKSSSKSSFALPRPWVQRMMSSAGGKEAEDDQERRNGSSSPDLTLVPPPDYSLATPLPPLQDSSSTQADRRAPDEGEIHYSSSAILKGLPTPYSSTSVLKGLPVPCPSLSHVPATPPVPPVPPQTPSPAESPPSRPSPPKPKPKIPLKPLKLSTSANGDSAAESSPETPHPCDLKHQPSVPNEDVSSTLSSTYGVLYPVKMEPKTSNELSTCASATASNDRNNEYSEIGEIKGSMSTFFVPNESCRGEVAPAAEVEEVPIEEEELAELSFQDKVASLASHLDLSKQRSTPKRQAPAPPPPSAASDQQLQHQPLSANNSIASNTASDDSYNNAHQAISAANSTPATTSTTGPQPPTSPSVSKRTVQLLQLSPLLNRRKESKNPTPPPPYEESSNFAYHYHRESKKSRSRFSLKKLLKFGKDSGGNDESHYSAARNSGKFGHQYQNSSATGSSSSSAGRQAVPERRPRPLILHPMDLANMAATANNSAPSSMTVNGGGLAAAPDGDQASQSSGSGSYESIPTPPFPADTPPVSEQPFSPSESPRFGDTYSGTPKSDGSCAPPQQPSSGQTKNKPPPPPRVKGSPQANKRPVRPPPPVVQSSPGNTPRSVNSTPPLPEDNASRDAVPPADAPAADGGEYANLGDVRTVLAPKKPERGSPGTTRRQSAQNGHHIPDCNDNEGLSSGESDEKETERMYYEPPEILSDMPPPIPRHGCPDSTPSNEGGVEEVVSANEQPINGNATPPNNKVTRQERQARVAGVVFLETNGGFVGSEESDSVSVSSSEVASSPASNNGGPRDISHLYAEVVRKAKRDRNAICLQVAPAAGDEGGQGEYNGCKRSGGNKRASLRNGLHRAVYRNLEDNYSAIVAANHETLGQLLEQALRSRNTCTSFSRLKDSVLHWSDFAVDVAAVPVVFRNTVVYNGTWGPNLEVTLMVTADPPLPQSSTRGPFLLTPLATFHEFLPSYVMGPNSPSSEPSDEPGLLRGTVCVFRRIDAKSLQDVSRELALLRVDDAEEFEQSVCLLLLQLISALKHLQAQGVEEVDAALDWLGVVRASDDSLQYYQDDRNPSLAMLQLVLIGGTPGTFDQGQTVSLCECGLEVMAILLSGDTNRTELDLSDNLSSKRALRGVAEALQKEKALSLSRAKAILELVLWGPTPEQSLEDDKALQRWLDLERANALSGLVSLRTPSRLEISVIEEYRLLFLVRTNWRALKDAAAAVSSTSTV